MKRRGLCIVLIALIVLSCQEKLSATGSERSFFNQGPFGAVSCGHPLAAKAAARVLKNGGNAVDAAVCAAFMLSVVDFHSSGLGGDGYALIRTRSGQIHAWDASVKLPRQHSTRPGTHHLGLPTQPEMLLKMLRLYGTRNRAEILSPAIKVARQGFKIGAHLEKNIEKKLLKITNNNTIEFLAPEGYPLRAGQLLKQPVLAETLMQLARDDGKSFYRGNQARALIKDMNGLGSEYRLEDLAGWRSKPVKPVRKNWQNYAIYGTPPPSSSIATVRLALSLLEKEFDLLKLSVPQIIEIAQMGKDLLDLKYYGVAQSIINSDDFFSMKTGRRLNTPDDAQSIDGTNTTHLCTWDKNGMVVSMTLTLGSHFGSGDLSPAGFFYNNGLMNYSQKVGSYQLNYPKDAGPVSAKSPIIVTKNNQPFLAIGGAGSNRIIFNTGLTLARVLSQPDSFKKSLVLPRFFMDYKNQLQLEWQPDIKQTSAIKKLYQDCVLRIGGDDYFGLVSAIKSDGNTLFAVGDHRRSGSCFALKKDPENKKVYDLEMIVKGRKKFASIDLATPINNYRQKAGKLTSRSAFKEFEVSENRANIELKHKSDSLAVRMKVEIDPSAKKNHKSPVARQEMRSPSSHESVRAFAARYDLSMPVNDYIQSLMIDIGHEIPYRRVSKRTSAADLLKSGYGDCSGKARLFNELLRLRGINSRLAGGLIFKKGLKSTTHLWLEAELDGEWQPICPVNQFFGHIPTNWILFRYDEERMTKPNAQVIFQLKEKKSTRQ